MFKVENVDKTIMGADCKEISLALERRGDFSPISWALGMLAKRTRALAEAGNVTMYDPDVLYDLHRKTNMAFSESGMISEQGPDGQFTPYRKINSLSRSYEDPAEVRLSFAEAGMVLAGLWTWIDTVSSLDYVPAEPLNAIGREDLAALNEAADQFAAALAPQKTALVGAR